MKFPHFRKPASLIGLDLGSSAVKAVELTKTGTTYKVAAFATEPIPTGSIVDGTIVDAAAVVAVIKRLFDNGRLKTKEVATSLSGNSVIVKKISVPVMTDSELAESIHWQAEQYIPFEIKEVNLDYQILGAGEGTGSDTMDVLLVAAKNDKIADYTGVIAAAGCTAVVVDVDAFALQNAYEANADIAPASVVVLLNAGASATNINIISGGQSVFTREISMGGNAYTEALQKELGLDLDQAEQLKRDRPVAGFTYEDARPVLRAVTENVMQEIRKTLTYYRATAVSDRLDRMVVSGGASRSEGFAEMLGQLFQTPVEAFDPFARIAFDAAKFKVDLAEVAPTAAVAVGLALRRAGDR